MMVATWPRTQRKADQKDQQRALRGLEHQISSARPLFIDLAERIRHRYADDEDEQWKDQVGRRPAIPGRVLQRCVDVFPATGVVDEQHSGNGDAANDVERKQTNAGHEGRIRMSNHKAAPVTAKADPLASVASQPT
jgi:hypothetical protein